MRPRFVQMVIAAFASFAMVFPGAAQDQPAAPQIQEEVWGLPLPLPMLAYLVRPVGRFRS
jgi:hypothetical protein